MENESDRQRHPNILVVMADGWRRQALGCAGADPVHTPHCDALAAAGTRFSRACTNHPLCTPARAAFLTGRWAPAIGMAYNWQRLPLDEPNLATACAAVGYDTALIGKWHLDDYEPDDPYGDHWNTLTPPGPRRAGFRYWYSNGCCHDHFQLRYVDTAGALHEGRGWQVDHETEVAIDYLRNRSGQRPADAPFCLWLNVSPPHNQCGGPHFDPNRGSKQYYAPEADEAIYRDRASPMANPDTDADDYQCWAPGYFGMVTAIDRALGRLLATLDELELADDTLVVVTSDHGEMLGTHGRWIKDIWYEESIGIPLIVRYPGVVPAGRVDDSLIGITDLMPSILATAGIAVPAGRDGRDCSAQWRGAAGAVTEPLLLAHNTGAPPPELTRYDFPDERGMFWRGLRTDRYVYVAVDQRPESVFYDPARRDAFPPHATRAAWDLVADPHQQRPIFPGGGHDDLLDELHAQLAGGLEEVGDDFLARYWRPTRAAESA